MHRSLSALVPAVALTCALAAFAALVPSSWIPIETSAAGVSEGQRLFDHETFGGKGRTCRTCHSGNDGTISLEEVRERLLDDPSDPLFLHDGLDGFFSGTTRIAAHATILIERELPEGVVLVDDPSASSVVLARGVPSTVNTPALDPALMYDIRTRTCKLRRRVRSIAMRSPPSRPRRHSSMPSPSSSRQTTGSFRARR
jgi:hypothetical protein